MKTLTKKTIIVGIGGGIAAYKTCELVRRLVKAGADVHVILTQAANQFVTPLTLQTLSQNPIHTDLFDITQEQKIGHIALATRADLIVIAPATADLIAKAAHGLANDLLTNVLLATRAPVLFCPSMNVAMWEHRATQENLKRLKKLKYHVMNPASGELACGTEGQGRLCEPQQILDQSQQILDIGQKGPRIKKTRQ